MNLANDPNQNVACEVFKSGWLKRMPHQERRLSVMTPFTKPPKIEKAWVSFCVHDATEPLLEFYENRRSAFSHNPVQRTSLRHCLHVSPSIRVQGDNEHVFAITLQGQVIKLGANSREQMIEWIDALRSKLREMVILTPKDNLYSKEPGGLRSPLLRNPASPLPPTPIFRFPPTGLDFREDASSINSIRMGPSPAPSMTLSVASGLSIMSSLSSMQSLNTNTGMSSVLSGAEAIPSPSVVTYVRNQPESTINRRSSFRQSLPGSPTTPNLQSGPVTFVRSPPAPQSSSGVARGDHVTVISVPSTSGSVFNFDLMGAALESSGAVAKRSGSGIQNQTGVSGGFEDFHHDGGDQEQFSYPDPNAVHVRVGNSLGGGGAGGSGVRLQVGSTGGMRGMTTTGYGYGGEGTPRVEGEGAAYEPLFLATTSEAGSSSSAQTGTQPQAPNTGLLRRRSEHRRSGRREQNRRSASVGPSIAPKQQQYQVGTDGRLMSLREQQVVRLQKEISHQAGVRLTLRKKDCVNAVAFVNCFNQVFVAGWKQREHPYLHNTFHLGDRLMSVGGTHLTTAAEAQNLIRNEPSQMVEFIIRRVPYGKVYALKRETEGQPLGIFREGNTAEIKEIIPGGLAAQHEVPSRSQTVDGLSYTTWVLTEINHRPLNLFFKHSEIADRLNAVGRDISILIQPSDLVKQLKRQLKLMKSYKDYIVM